MVISSPCSAVVSLVVVEVYSLHGMTTFPVVVGDIYVEISLLAIDDDSAPVMAVAVVSSVTKLGLKSKMVGNDVECHGLSVACSAKTSYAAVSLSVAGGEGDPLFLLERLDLSSHVLDILAGYMNLDAALAVRMCHILNQI